MVSKFKLSEKITDAEESETINEEPDADTNVKKIFTENEKDEIKKNVEPVIAEEKAIRASKKTDKTAVNKKATENNEIKTIEFIGHESVGKNESIGHESVGKNESIGHESVGKNESIGHKSVGKNESNVADKENKSEIADKPIKKSDKKQSPIKPLSADLANAKQPKAEKANDNTLSQKTKPIGIAHFDTAVQSDGDFKEDVNDKY